MLRLAFLLTTCIPTVTGFLSLQTANADQVVVTLEASDPAAQIDQWIRAKWERQQIDPAARCTDRVFVRRLYLDLAGRIPTTTEVNQFLADHEDDRRARLIDLLLSSEDHVQHFSDLFDALLMGRAAEHKYAQRREHHWRSYLESVIRDNRPWNDVVAEILLARPQDPDQQGAVWFLYEREDHHQRIAESIAPAFFGLRIECAQCHDHMLADEIKQQHYWGLVAFFNRSKNERTAHGPRVAESAIGGFSEFANVFGESSPNLLAFLGAETVHEDRPSKEQPQVDSDTLYRPAANEGEPRVPKFSRRQQFVEHFVRENPLIARALVNRVWAMMLARGIVHPFDQMDSVHAASHPELLDFLTNDFITSGHDIRRLVRAIARSEAYQLASVRPAGIDDPATFAWYLERPLTGEQLARSIQLMVRREMQTEPKLLGLMRQQFPAVLPAQNVVTVGEALFLSNNVEFEQYLRSSDQPDHLVPVLMNLADHASRVDTVFQAALGRSPADDERNLLIEYLNQREGSLAADLRQIVWSLLTSAEFRFNH